MNEISAADANTGYGARGVPAFTCRFEVKTSTKWQKIATNVRQAMKKASV
jgi:hypothetical protein